MVRSALKYVHALLGAALSLLCLFAIGSASAQPSSRGIDLRIITFDNGPATKQVLQALHRRYPALQVSADPRAWSVRKGVPVYAAVGPGALRAAIEADLDAPTIALFTSSPVYMEISKTLRVKRPAVTAIYAEASPIHQLQLISKLYNRRVSVGVLTSEATEYLEPLIRSGARSANLELEIARVESFESASRALMRLSLATAILAVPDSTIYAPSNLRNLLESTYRRSQPVIGFSTSLVNAGTIATAYSTIEDTLAQFDDVLELVASGRIPDPQFPRYWRVAVNENVARSLNVIVDDDVRSLGERPPEKPR